MTYTIISSLTLKLIFFYDRISEKSNMSHVHSALEVLLQFCKTQRKRLADLAKIKKQKDLATASSPSSSPSSSRPRVDPNLFNGPTERAQIMRQVNLVPPIFVVYC